jgi:hypothetical protein
MAHIYTAMTASEEFLLSYDRLYIHSLCASASGGGAAVNNKRKYTKHNQEN